MPLAIGTPVRVEKGRRTGVVVECDHVREGRVCVQLNGKSGARRHYDAERVEVKR
jgi:hypothetical protein